MNPTAGSSSVWADRLGSQCRSSGRARSGLGIDRHKQPVPRIYRFSTRPQSPSPPLPSDSRMPPAPADRSRLLGSRIDPTAHGWFGRQGVYRHSRGSPGSGSLSRLPCSAPPHRISHQPGESRHRSSRSERIGSDRASVAWPNRPMTGMPASPALGVTPHAGEAGSISGSGMPGGLARLRVGSSADRAARQQHWDWDRHQLPVA